MLHYGYSDIVNDIQLYFNYNTSFHDFLRTLRDQTVLCTIPPRDLPQKLALSDGWRSPTRESSKTLSIHEDLNSNTPLFEQVDTIDKNDFHVLAKDFKVETQSTKAKKYKGTGNNTSTTQNYPVPQVTRRPRSPSERGYTLNDGPWRYKVASKRNDSHFTDMTDEDGYQVMLNALKAEGVTGSGRNKVIVMHVSIHHLDSPPSEIDFANYPRPWTETRGTNGKKRSCRRG